MPEMTLRDLFAAFALAGILANSDDYDDVEGAAYENAGAMIAHRATGTKVPNLGEPAKEDPARYDLKEGAAV